MDERRTTTRDRSTPKRPPRIPDARPEPRTELEEDTEALTPPAPHPVGDTAESPGVRMSGGSLALRWLMGAFALLATLVAFFLWPVWIVALGLWIVFAMLMLKHTEPRDEAPDLDRDER